MNKNTKEALIAFIEELQNLAMAVSSFAGTDAVENVIRKGEALKYAVNHDETIL